MTSEQVKHSSAELGDQKQKPVGRGVRRMVAALTDRFVDLQKSGSSNKEQGDDQDDQGVRIVTLAGTNTGATLRSEMDEKASPPHGVSLGESEDLRTYVNSNFQAINNSIMMGGSYNTHDPGVHVDILDYFDSKGHKPDKHGKKGKRKEKESSKSDQQTTEHSDSD
ncbi:uncharacterized protein LOC121235494 [Juglans microcarpa x Juglans regia]|uniref:uncharacterized protein LOC121235494 n=1 Tax=Juglans microcarpa x Juglans regia TaxID=2249226 RepID=UPI001B7E52D6|nr:uncharacterized protein LOC121235494 [Juglans microcarpa x Juglans regia]